MTMQLHLMMPRLMLLMTLTIPRLMTNMHPPQNALLKISILQEIMLTNKLPNKKVPLRKQLKKMNANAKEEKTQKQQRRS
jgi:hypothetical protein